MEPCGSSPAGMMKKILGILIASCFLFSPLSFAVSTKTVFDTDTKLMLHMDDTGLTDSSAAPNTMTLNGGVSRVSNQSEFGGYSAYIDGTNNSFLSTPNNSDFDFGTGNFTIDSWIRYTGTVSTYFTIASAYQNSPGNDGWLLWVSGGVLTLLHFTSATPDIIFNQAVTFNADTWYHVMVSRSGNNFYFGWNGTVTSPGTSSLSCNSGGTGLVIGSVVTNHPQVDLEATGWIDELRIVKGTAVWTANFTPPTAAYIPPPVTTGNFFQMFD